MEGHRGDDNVFDDASLSHDCDLVCILRLLSLLIGTALFEWWTIYPGIVHG